MIIAPPATPYRVVATATPGSVSGRVTLDAPLTPLAPVPAGRDSALCGTTIPDSSLLQTASGLGNVVVWLEGVRSGKALPIERRLELESVNCILTPRVQGAVVGSAVNVLGHDEFRQHLRFVAGGEARARAAVLLGEYEQVIPTNLPFSAPGLVVVRDADHPWPRAYLAVFDHPYFDVTKSDGSFTIPDVPPGKYTLATWHERTGKVEQPVDVTAGGALKVLVTVTATR